MQETALWIPRGAFCPLEGGPRHIGTDTLAPVLHYLANREQYVYLEGYTSMKSQIMIGVPQFWGLFYF